VYILCCTYVWLLDPKKQTILSLTRSKMFIMRSAVAEILPSFGPLHIGPRCIS
jgi:hypothetical protein